MKFDESVSVMEPPRQTRVGAESARALMAGLSVDGFWKTPSPWDPEQEEEKLALLCPLDRFAQGALEIGTLLAVVALFLPVLV